MQSDLYAIPGFSEGIAGGLQRLGYTDVESLIGQNPRDICAALRRLDPALSDYSLPFLQSAVYYAETRQPDPSKLLVSYWKNL